MTQNLWKPLWLAQLGWLSLSCLIRSSILFLRHRRFPCRSNGCRPDRFLILILTTTHHPPSPAFPHFALIAVARNSVTHCIQLKRIRLLAHHRRAVSVFGCITSTGLLRSSSASASRSVSCLSSRSLLLVLFAGRARFDTSVPIASPPPRPCRLCVKQLSQHLLLPSSLYSLNRKDRNIGIPARSHLPGTRLPYSPPTFHRTAFSGQASLLA